MAGKQYRINLHATLFIKHLSGEQSIYMRFNYLLVFSFSISCFMACKKDSWKTSSNSELKISNSESAFSNYISYKNCSEASYKKDHVRFCFDSLLSDSRCPNGVLCVWQGTAIAKFLFTVNQDQHEITLSTFKLHGYPSDTTLMGYKIQFINLYPYPDIGKTTNISDYNAEIRISKQ
jgi:hypothetical protein